MARKITAADEATTVVNIADFQRTRDSVIVALATLQSSVQDLSRAYINHANTVLGPGSGGALDNNLTNFLSGSAFLPGRAVPAEAAPVEEPAGDGKKKRKRAKHDPNAPKRALTPYFLFMQTARAQIAKELGDNAKPKEVADEGTRRWGTMPPEDKHVWEEAYQKNLAAYRVRMAAYKAGQPVPDPDQAMRLVDAGQAPSQAQVDAIAGGNVDEDEDEDEPEPVKAPEPPKSAKRRKSDKPAAAPAPAPVEEPKPVASPKKSKKAKTEAAAPPPAPVPTPLKAEKKTKKSKKAA